MSASPNTSRSSREDDENPPTTQCPISAGPDVNPISNFLVMFFNIAYFLCIFPFRLIKKKEDTPKKENRFVIHSSWPQSLICATLTVLSLFWFIREIRICIPSKKSPAAYVQFALAVLYTIVRLVLIQNLWLNKQAFLDIVNFVSDHSTKYVIAQKRKLLGVAGLYIAMGIVLFLTIRGGDSITGGVIHDWSASRWEKGLVYAGRFNFFVSNEPFPELCPHSNQTLRTMLDRDLDDYVYSVDTILVTLAALGSYSRNLQGAFGELLLLMVVLTLWTAVKNFCDKVKAGVRKNNESNGQKPNGKVHAVANGNSENGKAEDEADVVSIDFSPVEDISAEWKDIYQGFQFLKKLSDLINKRTAMGLYVTLCIAGYVLYYAVFLDLVFAESSEKDWGRRVELIMFLASTCFILILSADLSHKMTTLKVWLSIEENRRHVPTDMVVIIFNQIDLKRVAISGSKIFPITYQSLFGMLGVTATYFILCVKDKSLAYEVIKCSGQE